MFIGRLRAPRLLPTTLNFSIFELYGFCFPTYYPYIYTYIELRISRYKEGNNTRLYLARLYLAFSTLPTLPIAAGLALAVLAEIASFVPIPPNIDIIVRFLLLQMVTSKNEIKYVIESTVRLRLQIRLHIWLRIMHDWRRWAIRISPSLPPGLYRDSLLWCNNGASSSADALSTIEVSYIFAHLPYEP